MSRQIRYDHFQRSTSYSGILSAACLAGTIFAGVPSPAHGVEGFLGPQPRALREVIISTGGNKSTYGRYSSPITGETVFIIDPLERAVTDFYAKLLNNQEPLGAEFEVVLHQNLWDLYES